MDPESNPKTLILSAKASFLFFILIMLAYLASSFFLASYLGLSGIFISQVGFLLLPIFIISLLYRCPLYDWPEWKKPSFFLVLLTIAGMVGVTYSIDFLMSLQQKIWPLPKFIEEFFTDLILIRSWKEAIVKGFILAITPAFCEEVLFRGMLQTSWTHRFGKKWGIIFTGFAFAVAHTNPWHFHFYLTLGIILSLLMEWKKSLWIPIIAHATNNLFTLFYPSG